MATKQEKLIAEAEELGIELTGKEKVADLEALISEAKAEAEGDEDTDKEDESDEDESEGEDDEERISDDSDEEKDEDESEDEEEAPAPKARSRSSKAPARLAPKVEDEAEEEEDPDYLRQYQYKKVAGKIYVGGVLTDPDKGSKAETMKKALLKQPRVRVLVPRAPGEHKSVLMTVNLNGYRLDFQKNTYVEMPRQVADVIMNSQEQTDRALQTSLIDSDTEKKTALS